MSSHGHYDAIIIGTGAGGGTLAWRLAPSGKRILLIERGNYVPREKDNWSTRAVNLEGRYASKEVWRDVQGKPGTTPGPRRSTGTARRTRSTTSTSWMGASFRPAAP